MREARVCLAKWRLAATERPCPLLPDDLFLSHVGPCLDGSSLANLQASSRYFWVPRPQIGPCATIALQQLGQPQTFYTVAPCERLQRRLDVGARLKVLRARNKFHRALSEWKDEVRRQRAAEKAAAQRAYESAKALLEDIEKAKDACAAAKAALPDNFAPGEVLEKIVDYERTNDQKRLRPFNNPRQCMLAPRPKAKFTKDAAAGNTDKPLFDIFRKPQKRQRTDDDDEVELVEMP